MRSISVGADFASKNSLQPHQKYSIRIMGETVLEARGTLNQHYVLSGLSILYRNYELISGDKIVIEYDAPYVLIISPAEKKRTSIAPVDISNASIGTSEDAKQQTATSRTVFSRKNLKHIHIEPFAENNFREWKPKTEADVYLVFGAISEFTDYKYCCGASTELLRNLEYEAKTKPDAILIDRATDEYLVAEFKMNSKDFKSNHHKDDIDVLICWIDDATDGDKPFLPDRILDLSALIEKSIKEGDIEI